MAQTLFCIFIFIIVNNYEVNTIIKSYLLVWMNEQKHNYIPCAKLLLYFPTKYHGFIRKFFMDSIFFLINIENVYYDYYFVFICIFTFFECSKLIPLFLSMCKIHSNVFITKVYLIIIILETSFVLF